MSRSLSSVNTGRLWVVLLAAGMIAALACPYMTTLADAVSSGQRLVGQTEVEPAVDDLTGNTIYFLTPLKVPFPSKSNPMAAAPMYFPIVSSVLYGSG